MTTSSTPSRALIVISAIAWMVAGIWITGNLTPNVYAHGAAVAGWTALTVGGVWLVTRHRHDFRWLAIGSTVASLVVMVAIGGWLSRPKAVNEDIVTADRPARSASEQVAGGDATDVRGNTLVASGNLESLAHATSGKVEVIRLEDGSLKLTLQDFTTDPGPDLFVYAVAGSPDGDGDVEEFINLGALKGTEGNQQYDLPRDFDATVYRHVYIWCRAFTVGFGRAEIEA